MNTATLVTRVANGGNLSMTALQAAVAAVGIPADPLEAIGVRVVSDATAISGNFAVRTTVLSFIPSANAAATVAVDADGHIYPPTVTAPGANYVIPPIVTFGGTAAIDASGVQLKPKARATLKVVSGAVVAPGSGYTAPSVKVVGGLNPSNPLARAATVTLTLGGGGNITGVVVTDSGAGYVSIPRLVITDLTGVGGVLSVSMGVGAVVVDFRGEGVASPSVILTPAFKVMFPNSSNQALPFFDLLTSAIADAVNTPVVADPPVLA